MPPSVVAARAPCLLPPRVLPHPPAAHASCLATQAEALAASWGCRSMALHVDPSNTAAIKVGGHAGSFWGLLCVVAAVVHAVNMMHFPIVLLLCRTAPQHRSACSNLQPGLHPSADV